MAVDGREDVREKLDALVDRVKGLRKRTAEATLFLTVYDLRRAQEVRLVFFFSCVVRRKRAHISGCRAREAVGEVAASRRIVKPTRNLKFSNWLVPLVKVVACEECVDFLSF